MKNRIITMDSFWDCITGEHGLPCHSGCNKKNTQHLKFIYNKEQEDYDEEKEMYLSWIRKKDGKLKIAMKY